MCLLATDASPYGVGAVLSHIDEKGDVRMLAGVSRRRGRHRKVNRIAAVPG